MCSSWRGPFEKNQHKEPCKVLALVTQVKHSLRKAGLTIHLYYYYFPYNFSAFFLPRNLLVTFSAKYV